MPIDRGGKKFKASGLRRRKEKKKKLFPSIPIFIVARYDRCNRHAISSELITGRTVVIATLPI